MKQNLFLLFFLTLLLSQKSFSQETEYQIIDSLKNIEIGYAIEVYPINEFTIDSKKYEEVESENPVYKERLNQIESLIKDSISLENSQKTYKEHSQDLINAKESMQKYLDDRELPVLLKLSYLKEAQKFLDKANCQMEFYRDKNSFYEACGGNTDSKISRYISESQGKIDIIIREGLYYESKKENLSNKIINAKKELTYLKKTGLVLTETGITKRKILKVDSINISKEISGRYIKVEGPKDEYGQSKYYIMKKEFYEFQKYELVVKDSLEKYTSNIQDLAKYVGGENKYLIKNVETGKLYYTTGNILKNWGMDYFLVELFSRIDKLNIKRQTVDDDIILSLNGSQCILTTDIVKALYDGDASCIKTMTESVNKYKEYNKIGSDIAVKLTNYIKQYKSRLLKDDGLANWKKDTKECDAILIKMRNLPYANSEYYNYQLDEEDIKIHTTILDLVRYSKDKLGI